MQFSSSTIPSARLMIPSYFPPGTVTGRTRGQGQDQGAMLGRILQVGLAGLAPTGVANRWNGYGLACCLVLAVTHLFGVKGQRERLSSQERETCRQEMAGM
jgi:hypothetical protein